MTNNERDTLLINLTTSVNNIQISLNDLRAELKSDIKAVDIKLDKTAEKLDAKIDQTAQDLRADMKEMDQNIRADMKKMDQNIRADMKKMDQELRNEIKKSAENTTKELKDYIAFDDTGITEMFRDVWMREKKRDERLDKHDEEIRAIKSKLA